MPALALRLAISIAVLLQQARLLPRPTAAARTNLTVGDTLTPPDYITSPSGGFAFGFRAHDGDPNKFLLATWFRVGGDDRQPAPPVSVVWFAKELEYAMGMGATLNATARSVLSIPAADGQLTLTDGSRELWRATTASTQRGSVLVLRDSGNAQFLSDSGVLWESFGYPTDTLLPGQSFKGYLFSKRADAEFATGRFSLAAQDDGNVVLCADLFTGDIQQNAYWATGTNGPNGNTTISFDGRGGLSYTLYDGTVHSLISPSTSSSIAGSSGYFQFARMDPDGIVRTYARPRTNNGGENTSWAVTGTLPSQGGCELKTARMQGMCGPGSYCVETKERLRCLCPTGYAYVDAQHADSGCTPAFEPQSCGGDTSGGGGEFSLVEMPNTTWEISIYYKKFPAVTEQQCRDYCLADCFCAAALMIGGSDCAEVGALAFGRQGSGITTTALIKVRTNQGNNTTSHTASARTRKTVPRRHMMIVTICLASLLAITVGGGLVAQHYYRARNRVISQQQQPLSSSVRAFSWKELYQATDGFKELLGKGSFGEVYKGTLRRRSPQPHLIAVKKLIDSNEYSEQEFTNEVQSIGQIHHRNLVRMIGYCKEGKQRMLVFEFMPGGSLRGYLFNPDKRPQWRWRAEAALAIARGLEYLHDGCSAPIIHCDIKPDNILLDGRGVPRITDFGISKLLGNQQVHTTVTHVRGTRGYIAPEWLRGDARVDTKADVYSFGVVLLEMISCRRCQEPVVVEDGLSQGGGDDDDETVTLFGWAAQLVGMRRAEVMLRGDAGVDTVEDVDVDRVDRFARVALWCIETNPQLRPTMHQVVQMLEGSQ
ncbi:unnamed protein product [Urochloa decumbens]|uniref:Receptor-like serine/threonine-protein kinase n=1 Tax=Urochloa decumbens TaxID=240449 RepID=A0ABC8Z8F0_9POAL